MSEPRRACSVAAGDAEPVNLGVPVPAAGMRNQELHTGEGHCVQVSAITTEAKRREPV